MQAWLRYGQGHVALTALGALAGAAAVQGVPLRPPLAVLAALGTWAVYVGERLVASAPEDAANHPDRTRVFAAHRRRLAGAVALALVGCAGAWLRLPAPARAAAGVACAGALYALPAVRRSALAKTALVAAAWGAGAGLLPPLAAGLPLDRTAVAAAFAVALLVASNALLLDVLDADGDRAAGRRTFANRLPVSRYQALVAVVLAAAVGAMAAAARLGGVPASDAAWAFVPHAVLAVATARLPRLRPPDAVWLDLAVGALGLVALARWG